MFSNTQRKPRKANETFFKATNFNRLQKHLFELFVPQLTDKVDSDFVPNTLLLQQLYQNYTLTISNDQSDIDAEQIQKRI